MKAYEVGCAMYIIYDNIVFDIIKYIAKTHPESAHIHWDAGQTTSRAHVKRRDLFY